jgi:hypothetical protein
MFLEGRYNKIMSPRVSDSSRREEIKLMKNDVGGKWQNIS